MTKSNDVIGQGVHEVPVRDSKRKVQQGLRVRRKELAKGFEAAIRVEALIIG